MGSNLRGRSQEQLQEVRQLTEQGLTQKEIEAQTGVPLRTQRDWKARGYLGPTNWPEEHKWPPNWTIERLVSRKLPDFKPEVWESNLAMIRTAEAQGNHRIGWFFKNFVELAGRQEFPEKSINWPLAISGLPVLAEWLECPPCEVLATLIEEHQPWQPGNPLARQKRRAAYQRSARVASAAVRQCVVDAQARLFQLDQGQQRITSGPVLLGALAELVPMFDRVPRTSPYKRFNLGGIMLGIIATPKGDNHGE